MQSASFGVGLFEDRNIRVGIFPKLEKFQIGRSGFSCKTRLHFRASLSKFCNRTRPAVADDARVVFDFLEFLKRMRTLLQSQKRLASQVRRNDAGIAQVS